MLQSKQKTEKKTREVREKAQRCIASAFTVAENAGIFNESRIESCNAPPRYLYSGGTEQHSWSRRFTGGSTGEIMLEINNVLGALSVESRHCKDVKEGIC